MPDGCVVEGCPKPKWMRVYCVAHYKKWLRYGDPLTGKTKVQGSAEDRFWAKVDRHGADECWEWTAHRQRQGYGQFAMDRGGTRWRTEMAHRVALEFSGVEVPADRLACHHCDNPPCCNPAHLYVGTHGDNARDREQRSAWSLTMLRPEQRSRGESIGTAKLDEDSVREIRRLYDAGAISQARLGEMFGVHQTKISEVVRRRTWKHVA